MLSLCLILFPVNSTVLQEFVSHFQVLFAAVQSNFLRCALDVHAAATLLLKQGNPWSMLVT